MPPHYRKPMNTSAQIREVRKSMLVPLTVQSHITSAAECTMSVNLGTEFQEATIKSYLDALQYDILKRNL